MQLLKDPNIIKRLVESGKAPPKKLPPGYTAALAVLSCVPALHLPPDYKPVDSITPDGLANEVEVAFFGPRGNYIYEYMCSKEEISKAERDKFEDGLIDQLQEVRLCLYWLCHVPWDAPQLLNHWLRVTQLINGTSVTCVGQLPKLCESDEAEPEVGITT